MEIKNEDKKEELNPKLKILLKLLIIISIVIILYQIEKFHYKLILTILKHTLIKSHILSIIIDIILHLILIKYLVYLIAFAGYCFLISRPVKFQVGQNQANLIYKNIISLQNVIYELINEENNIDYNSSLQKIRKCFNTISHFINIFYEMKIKFNNLSNKQILVFDLLNAIKNNIVSSKIYDYVSYQVHKNAIENSNKEINIFSSQINTTNNNEEEDEINYDNVDKNISNYKIKLEEILKNIKNLKFILQEYLNINYKWYSYKKYYNYFTNNIFGTIFQYHIELNYLFNFEEHQLKTKDKKIIEYIIIKSNSNKNKTISNSQEKNNLMIICGPNGAPFQQFCKYININIYLKNDIDVLCWNYRGYGFSTGHPNFDNLRSDIIEIYDEIKPRFNKIGVHGISIGGIPACYLAKKVPEIKLLVSDRNFGEMGLIILPILFGNFLYKIWKILLFSSTYTIDDFIESKCYKIVLNDPNDTLVCDCASLKTLTSKKIIENYIIKNVSVNNNNNININNINNENSSFEKKVSIELSNNNSINNNSNNHFRHSSSFEEKKNFLILNNNNNNNNKNYSKDALDLLLSNKNEKENFIQTLIDISNAIKYENFNLPKNCKESFFFMYNLYIQKNYDSSNEQLQNSSVIMHFITHKMSEFFDCFESAGASLIYLLEVKSNSNRIKKIFINNFFNNLLIWGNKQISGDLHSFTTKYKQKVFKDAAQSLENFLESQEIINVKNTKIIKDIEILYKYLKQMESNIKLLSFVNIKNNNNNKNEINNEEMEFNLSTNHFISNKNSISSLNLENDNYENILQKIGRGNLISLNCGHNGSLNFDEILTFEYYLKESGFFQK